ncbi:unnamed protein product [Trichobilharzia szidati]|nr:unnamed protein product [Trichobilharzia szidati]
MELILDRSAHTLLLPIIQRLVLPGTTIHTDEWAEYSQISQLGYIHHRVNHSNDSVDPVTGTHNNSIEGFWGRLKNRIKAINGFQNQVIFSHLDEYMYRNWFNLKTETPIQNWEIFLSHIREKYPV